MTGNNEHEPFDGPTFGSPEEYEQALMIGLQEGLAHDGHTQYEGRWWLPDQPEVAVGGTLSIGGMLGGVLRLHGSLPQRPTMDGTLNEYGVVLGESIEGERITLLRSVETASKGTLGNSVRRYQEVTAFTVIVGRHLEMENPRFQHIGLTLTYLSNWSRELGRIPVVEESSESDFVVRYTRSNPRTAMLADGRRVNLIRDLAYRADGSTWRLDEQCFIRIDHPSEIALDDAFDQDVMVVQNLLSFASMTANRPQSVVGLNASVLSVDTPVVKVMAFCKVHRAGVERPPTPEAESWGRYGMLFTLANSPVPFEQLIPAWFALSDQLGPIVDLYLSLEHAPPVHVENEFINVCQTAEGYHRVSWQYPVMPEEEHRALRKTLLCACTSERREWLSGILSHSNEPSFKRRIEDLVEKAGPAVEPLLRTRRRYAARVRDMRNNLAHWLNASAPDLSVAHELYDLTMVTRFVIAACLLRDLGWSEADAANALASNWRFQRVFHEGGRALR